MDVKGNLSKNFLQFSFWHTVCTPGASTVGAPICQMYNNRAQPTGLMKTIAVGRFVSGLLFFEGVLRE